MSSPKGDGVRILSLDGGDSRSLSQLLILEELMKRLEHDTKEDIRPCEYFHSMTGVGAGGIVAIFLGVFGVSIDKAIELFGQLCQRVFPSEGCDEATRSLLLEESIVEIMKELQVPEDTRLWDGLDLGAGCHVSICYSSSVMGVCRMFRNYKSRQPSYSPTIVEAVRAAWATPGLFSPIHIGAVPTQEEVISAVNGFCNPTQEALREAEAVFGKERLVSTVLSLGSGRRTITSSTPRLLATQIAQEADITAENLQRRFGSLGIYFRFSIDQGIETKDAELQAQFALITAHTREYLNGDVISRSLDSYLKTSASTSSVSLDRLCRSKSGGSKSSMGLPPLSAFFTMRTGPMNQIITALQKTPHDSPALALVTGLGGTGKTQISLKYAYDHGDQYDHILFVDASSTESLEKSLISRIRSIDRQLRPENAEEAIELLTNPMGNLSHSWFLIMDNADNTDMDLRDYIPPCDHGQILITSRNSALGDLFPEGHVILDVMSNDEAVEALLSAALGPKESADAERPRMNATKSISRTKGDYSCATQIVKELGYLPLAVIQAACYIKKQKCLHEYPNLLKNSRSRVLRWPASVQRDKLKYAHSTYAAFDTTLGALSSRTLQFLGIISFFHFSNFPKPLVGVAASYKFGYQPFELIDRTSEYQTCINLLFQIFCPSGHWDPMELDALLEELQNYSLVSLVPVDNVVTLRFHPLLHSWANDRLSESDRELFRAAAIRLLVCGTNRDDDYLRTYLSAHMDRFSILSEQFHVNDKAALTAHLNENWNYETVLIVWKGIYAEVEAVYGEKDVRTTRATLQLADAFSDVGDWDTMEKMEKEVIEMRKDILGEHHLETIDAMSNLARTYKSKDKRYIEAVVLETEVLRVRREQLGPNHRRIVDALEELALTRLLEKKYSEAESLLMEAMDMVSNLVGKEHNATINIMALLGKCYKRKGNEEKTIQIRREIAELQRTVRGEEHSRTIEAMIELARSYSYQNQYPEAEKIWREVIDIQRKLLGDRDESTLSSLYMQAFSVAKQGRHDEAEALWRELLAGELEVFGERHHFTVDTADRLARSVMAQRRYTDAEILFQGVVKIREEVYDETHPDTLKARHHLALSIHHQHRYSDSEPIWRNLLAYYKENLEDSYYAMLQTMGYLHHALYSCGRSEESDALINEMTVAARVISDPEVLIAGLHYLASALHGQDRHEEAITLWDEIIARSQSLFGKDDSMTIMAIEEREVVRKCPLWQRDCLPEDSSAEPGKVSDSEAAEVTDSSQES
ncbi:hypothetical protein M408DRAFT_214514 [Serendipita vermifera MAFF 305830]|uniref:PNPLA domain-containing protein n=1 Tax=Serendipita vermifera MAFF 305830 TaxID=933852 RepID=A0A0C2XTE0_SERVB|nr:hypothetical protein M408DRAFT_214514 [Serendipita vermifera MAFF 305830]